MRKKAILLLLMLGLLSSCKSYDAEQKEELQIVLGNLSTSSFIITVDVKCGNEKFPIVIDNESLFYILFQRKDVKNKEDYINEVTRIITKKQVINFDMADKEMIKSYSVTLNDSIETFLNDNKEGFISKYFEDNWLKSEEISFIHKKAILYYLFKNKIYCKRDCVSGYIFIVPGIGNYK